MYSKEAVQKLVQDGNHLKTANKLLQDVLDFWVEGAYVNRTWEEQCAAIEKYLEGEAKRNPRVTPKTMQVGDETYSLEINEYDPNQTDLLDGL